MSDGHLDPVDLLRVLDEEYMPQTVAEWRRVYIRVAEQRDRYKAALEKIHEHGDNLDCVIEAREGLWPSTRSGGR